MPMLSGVEIGGFCTGCVAGVPSTNALNTLGKSPNPPSVGKKALWPNSSFSHIVSGSNYFIIITYNINTRLKIVKVTENTLASVFRVTCSTNISTSFPFLIKFTDLDIFLCPRGCA